MCVRYVLLALLALGACGGDEKDTAASCPDELTYLTTAKPFVEKYCISCHSEDSKNRVGAPPDVNFDEESGLFDHGTHVYEYVLDKTMPLSGFPQPTATERKAFTDWAKCSGVSESHDHD
jgi:uncharacterized membrane protein